jgi:hypothetical protein
LLGLQIVVFVFFRWERVDFYEHFDVAQIRWTLNPSVVWLAVCIIALGIQTVANLKFGMLISLFSM